MTSTRIIDHDGQLAPGEWRFGVGPKIGAEVFGVLILVTDRLFLSCARIDE